MYDNNFDEVNGSISPLRPEQRNSDSSMFQEIANYGQNLVDRANDRTKGIFSKIFPDTNKKLVRHEENQTIQGELAFRRQALMSVRQTQMQRLQQACNEYLQMEKASSIHRTQVHIMQEFQAFQRKLDNMFDEFREFIDEKYIQLEFIHHPKLKEAKKEQIDRDINAFKALQEQAINQFLKTFRQYF